MKIKHEAAEHLAQLHSVENARDQSTYYAQANTFVGFSTDANWATWRRSFTSKPLSKESVFAQVDHPESIILLIRWVNQQTKFCDLFQHPRTQIQHESFNFDNILACLLAKGTHVGLMKLTNISDQRHRVLMQT